MSDHDGSTPSISDLELDFILQTATNDLAESLERVTDLAAGVHAITSQEASSPISDTELDAVLEAANVDLITGLGRVIDTQTGVDVITAMSYEEARRRHPTMRGSQAAT